LRAKSEMFTGVHATIIHDHRDVERFRALLEEIQRRCLDYGLTHTSELAECAINRPPPETYAEILSELTHLNDSLSNQLKKDAVFRVPPEWKKYYEQDDLFWARSGQCISILRA
jgi:hypothetical protein